MLSVRRVSCFCSLVQCNLLTLLELLLQARALAFALSTPFMMYTALGILTNCRSPAVVVLSSSMEPGIHRGVLLFLSNHTLQEYKNGDITVYQVPGDQIPIVHRVVQTHTGPPDESGAHSYRFLTKGDNNEEDDLTLYCTISTVGSRHVTRHRTCSLILMFIPQQSRQNYHLW
ncbi:hypothetical protein B0H11DRAFT_1757152 [Mycena galericulata]|nr:hypothetical protein B0H11DRAFT_1757152 [Mycena galericulata]